MKASKVIEARKEKAIEEKSALLGNAEKSEALKIRPLEFFSDRLLELKDVRALYDGRPVNEGVSFAISGGDRVALNGKNGCGKSSLLKAILGTAKFSGEIIKSSKLKISYVAQDESSLSGSLDDYARKYGVDETLFRAVLDKFGFDKKDFFSDISAMSAGQKKKASLARSLCEQAHLYIWDEPLNYIDVLSRGQIEELILAFRPTLLFVEHDKTFRLRIASRIVSL